MQGVTGYPQMLLVMERILDATVAVAQGFGPVEVQARKTYTTLLTPRRTFSAVKPTTRSRVDLVRRLEGTAPGSRLLDARGAAGGGLNLRILLASVDDLDDEAVDLLHRAYLASLP